MKRGRDADFGLIISVCLNSFYPQARNQLNVPSNHKMTTSGSKKTKKTPALACLKVKNGGKEETTKKKPAKKNLPSPRKPRSGDNIPCKGRC